MEKSLSFQNGKSDSNTDVFLWIFRNFEEHLFWRTSAYGCLWITPRGVARILRKIWDGEPCNILAAPLTSAYSLTNSRQAADSKPAITCSKLTIETLEQGV